MGKKLSRPPGGRNTTLRADPLVNPIPMPNRPFSIDFRSRPPFLDVGDAQSTIDIALEDIAAHIRQIGDGPLRSGGSKLALRWPSRTLILRIHAYVQLTKTKLTYGDAAAVLRLLKLKLTLEGHDGWSGRIFVTETAQVVGYVDLRRIPQVPPELAPVEAKAVRQVRRRDVLPNPYPVPDRPFVIDFAQQGGQFPPLVPADVDRCINGALQFTIQHVQTQGDGSIPHQLSIYNRATKLQVVVTSIRNDAMLSYNDTVVIIETMGLKMRRDGYRARLGHIIATSTGDLLGDISLRRLGVGQSPQDRHDVNNGSINAERQMLRSNPLPNPYHLPHSPYSINFKAPDPLDWPLPAGEVGPLISKARDQIAQEHVWHPDTWLPYNHAAFYQRYRSVYLLIRCSLTEPTADRLKYSDALAVVTACAMKIAHEGYHSLDGDIFDTATGKWKGNVEVVCEEQNQAVGNTNETQLGLALIPNPYPLPNTDLLLDFKEPGMRLAETDVKQCILTARGQVLQDIARHGEDSPAPPSTYSRQSVAFRIYPEPVGKQRRLTLGELLAVLDGYERKSAQEGYRSRWGRIVVAGVEEQIIAEVLLSSAPNVEVTTS
ncbi:MAG: hypothetical protein LQ341_004768 [Variospora aurantia]|nr:MAG: hypothetical protein LQ341_004768 [Variospora aurantia]